MWQCCVIFDVIVKLYEVILDALFQFALEVDAISMGTSRLERSVLRERRYTLAVCMYPRFNGSKVLSILKIFKLLALI